MRVDRLRKLGVTPNSPEVMAMKRTALALIAVFAMTLSNSAAQYGRPKKKLIQYGWGVPYTDFVRENANEMEKNCPFFDGIVIRLRGGWKAYPAHIFRKSAATLEEYGADMANLKATKFERFRENFALAWGTAEKGWDWFDENDWRAAEQNARLIAHVAKVGGLIGICFDPEPYGENPWHYPSLPNAKTKSFSDYYARVRECGANFMRVIQDEFPNLRILTFFWGSILGDLVDVEDQKEVMTRLSKHGYGLLPAFLNGMLDAVSGKTIIIDGNEPAYYYRSPEQYFRAYHLMRQRALSIISPENREKYAIHVQAGFALYMDFYFGLVPFEVKWGRLSHYLTPQERAKWFEHNVYWALYTTDEYVWCYSERLDWWGTQEKAKWFKFVPEGAPEAIQSARRKLDESKPLGFDIRDMLQAAEQKMREKQAKSLIRHEARVQKLQPGEEPPKIDGRIDDIIWQNLKPLEEFVMNLESAKTKPSVKTVAWLTYDDRYLYVAFQCEELFPEKMKIVGEKLDDEIWLGDCVELLISLGDSPKPYRHFIVNPRNVKWDGASVDGGDDPSWNADWKSATFIGKNAWTCEMAIPWESVGKMPKVGEKRRVNLCRQRCVDGVEWTTWSQVIDGFLEAENFGVIWF